MDNDIKDKLVNAGMRPTRQRMRIASWLFNGPDKHFTAEQLYQELVGESERVSLATIYNTLGAFTDSNLLRTVSAEAGRVFYDTNTSPHYHVFDQDFNELHDIGIEDLKLTGIPNLPSNQVIDQVDIIIRTRRTRRTEYKQDASASAASKGLCAP